MQSSTGQYSTQAGEPAQPVQHSVMTANSFGFFLRGVSIPLDLGSNLSSSGTIPTARVSAGMGRIIALSCFSALMFKCHIVHSQFWYIWAVNGRSGHHGGKKR